MSREHQLPITRQCELLDHPRSTFYHAPSPVSEVDLELKTLMDRCHIELPFYGSRWIAGSLRDEGHNVNRKRVQRLTRTMGITAAYSKHYVSSANTAHKVCSYLLRNLIVSRPNQVRCADVTNIPTARGFVYLVALMDWHSHKVLA
ncbi:MAG: IS3 family transposase [Pseudomonadota bacterium]